MSRVVHFQIPADNPARAEKFYVATFGWRFQKWNGPMPYWLIETGEGPGIDGGMAPREQPGEQPVNTIGVESLEKTTAAVQRNGGKVLANRIPIPGVGWLATCQDTEGNQFLLMQADESAR